MLHLAGQSVGQPCNVGWWPWVSLPPSLGVWREGTEVKGGCAPQNLLIHEATTSVLLLWKADNKRCRGIISILLRLPLTHGVTRPLSTCGAPTDPPGQVASEDPS